MWITVALLEMVESIIFLTLHNYIKTEHLSKRKAEHTHPHRNYYRFEFLIS